MSNISGLLDTLTTIPEERAAGHAYSWYFDVLIRCLRQRACNELPMPNRKDPFPSGILEKVEVLQRGLISLASLMHAITKLLRRC